MNIYFVEREDYVVCGEYASSIVYAKSCGDAFDEISWAKEKCIANNNRQGDNIRITLLGKAKEGVKAGIILEDYIRP